MENPFGTEACEEEFVLQARLVIDRHYRQGEPDKNPTFEFGPGQTMSRTEFWALSYIYLLDVKAVKPNLQGFINVVQRHFGNGIALDRSGISRKEKSLNRLHVSYKHSFVETEGLKARKQRDARAMYEAVAQCWAPIASATARG